MVPGETEFKKPSTDPNEPSGEPAFASADFMRAMSCCTGDKSLTFTGPRHTGRL